MSESSGKSKQSHSDHGKKHGQQSSATPVVALTPIAVAVSEAAQAAPAPIADATSQAPAQATHGRGHHTGDGNAVPVAPVVSAAQPDPNTVVSDTAPTVDGAALPAPDPSDAGLSPLPAPLTTSTHGQGRDDGVPGPPGHSKTH